MSSQGYSPYTMNEYIKNVVKLILNNSTAKLPIKKSDIITNAVGGNTKFFNDAVNGAKEILLDVYGIKLHEVPESKSTKSYITTSTLESSVLELTEKQKPELTLLFLVLSYIFMKGEPVNEEVVIEYLKKLKIPMEEPNDSFPFVVKKLLTETFVKQLYLKRTKVQPISASEAEYILEWGYRAQEEFSKKDILDIVANILQKPAVCFVRQHSEVRQKAVEMEIEVEN
ncbi:melanoma-associated antigen D2 [Condylostylus longicornis]|uniref:melanoma-associated antigen D2 n=1 Tax=Condylostylus longicornis TaxID=2530218 RepID=UPI00244E08E0|nr:melanoma-associated antigen D2 [Condylostylus longicornis]